MLLLISVPGIAVVDTAFPMFSFAIVIAGVPGLLLSSLLVFVDTLESFRIWNRDRGGLEVALHLNSVLKRCKTLRVFCKFQNTLFCKSVLKHG